jgi:hypothetical protein
MILSRERHWLHPTRADSLKRILSPRHADQDDKVLFDEAGKKARRQKTHSPGPKISGFLVSSLLSCPCLCVEIDIIYLHVVDLILLTILL